MKNLLIIFGCIFFSINASGQNKPPLGDAAYRMSIIKLLSNPEFYNEKKVLIKGIMHCRFEDSAIYFSQDHADYLMVADALWLNYSKNLLDSIDVKSFDGKYVSIVGVFNMNKHGHMGGFAGSIEEITSVYELKNYSTNKKK